MRAHLFAIAVALGGCGMIKTSSSTGPGGPSSSSASGPTTGGGSDLITVPNLIGMTEDQAAAAVKAAGFTLAMEQSPGVDCDSPPAEGKVKCQEPDAGKSVLRTALVQVNVPHERVSKQDVMIKKIQGLVGLPVDQAQAKIKSWGYESHVMPVTAESNTREIYDAKCGENRVCSVDNYNGGWDDSEPINLYVNHKVNVGAPPPPP